MRIGKVSESVLKRSVLKQITNKRTEVLSGAGIGKDFGVLQLEEGEELVFSTGSSMGPLKGGSAAAVHAAVNNLACAKAVPVAVLTTILLPPETEETILKEMMRAADQVCKELHLQIAGGHTEVTAAVSQPVINVTGLGRRRMEECGTEDSGRRNRVMPGMDLVVTKWIALEGTAILAREKEQELSGKLPRRLVQTARDFGQYISLLPEAAVAAEQSVPCLHDITNGGVFGALWELAEGSGVGLEVDLRAIPVRQETVEICECLQVNPYLLLSGGSMLAAVENGGALVRAFQQAGIEAAVIGKAVEGNDRVLLNAEERRYLDKPMMDEIYKVFA